MIRSLLPTGNTITVYYLSCCLLPYPGRKPGNTITVYYLCVSIEVLNVKCVDFQCVGIGPTFAFGIYCHQECNVQVFVSSRPGERCRGAISDSVMCRYLFHLSTKSLRIQSDLQVQLNFQVFNLIQYFAAGRLGNEKSRTIF